MTGASTPSSTVGVEPRSATVRVNGFDLHSWEWAGNEPTLICLHPSGHYGRIWESVARLLSPQFRVVALDQRGHGDSGQPASGSSAQDYASDVAGFVEAQKMEKVGVVGHSLGARTAMVFAAEHPERVSHVILVGGPHFSTLQAGADVQHWQTQAKNMRERPQRMASADAAAEILRASYPKFTEQDIQHAVQYNTRPLADGGVEWRFEPEWVAKGLDHALDDLRPYAARIKAPVLVLRPHTSWELTPERMPQVIGAFSGTTVTVQDLSGSANLEVEVPLEVADAIRATLTAR